VDVRSKTIAEDCLKASHDATMAFPEIVRTLIEAGFEGYTVDYRRGTTTYYLPDGDSVMLGNDLGAEAVAVAAAFDADGVEAAVRRAQANAPGYSYKEFSRSAKASGCAGYIVSFAGRRVVYFGRTAETHVEHFPGSAP
jgi:uncharacterized protein YbcV (DUF1398 family)